MCVAFTAALISCLFVHIDKQYVDYFDLRTLALLYCLMVVVAGLREAGLFDSMAHSLCERVHSARGMGIVLVFLCFFSAMLITNDVALLTFVPFAIIVLRLTGHLKDLIWIVVLQTVAANLGSMLTPVGNPQNLYIYSHYNLSAADFFTITAPVWMASGILVAVYILILPRDEVKINMKETHFVDKKKLCIYGILFAVCLLVVARLISWVYMVIVLVAVLLIFDRRQLLKADFCLLLTFVFFFVFSGNLARIDSVATLLKNAIGGRELFIGLAVSQVISNVPATLLLSSFTENAGDLMLGVDIGGLGTPIASLASLISLKLYLATENAKTGKFLRVFLMVNFVSLFLLIGVAFLIKSI